MINPFSNPSYLLPPLISVAVTLALLTLVLFTTRRDFNTWIFCGFLFSVALWSLLTFGMRFSPDIDHALPWTRALSVPAFAVFVFYYHFTLSYTNTRGKRGFLLAAYLLLVVVAALAPTDLVVKGVRLEHYGYAPITGVVTLLLYAAGPVLVTGGAYNLLKRYKVASSYEERNRLLYLVVAAAFPVLGGGLDAFSNLPPLAIWSNLIFCILCSVAILKYHLLDIRIVVRKTLVYLILGATVAIPYVGILHLVHYISGPRLEPWWGHAIVILVLAIVLRPLYSRAQGLVDRAFYRDRYDKLRALERFSQEAHSIISVEELGSKLVQLLGSALRSSSAGLLLAAEGSRGFRLASSTGLDNPPSGIVLRTGSPLVKWLTIHHDILSSKEAAIVPQLQSLSPGGKNILNRMEAALYVPIETRQGELSGILVLGQKLSQQSYSSEDRELLKTLTSHVAMALENAQLYHNATQRQQALQASLEEKEVLLREIHHRVKNNLQVISSLLNLQAGYIEDERYAEMFKESQERVKSMALVHEKLYQSKDLARVDFAGYIESMVQELRRSYGSEGAGIGIKTEVENIRLGVDYAIPCGLIINELVSNSLKHAFPQGEGGEVRIAMRQVGEDGIELEVSDNGAGISESVEVRNSESLGLRLVSILAEEQLGGEMELDRNEGTRFRIRFRVE